MEIRSKQGFTLVEILSCVVIVAVLIATVLSVYGSAKSKGKEADEISQMHQIGLAANLYHEQTDGWPGNTNDLVVSGLMPREICKSPRDKVPEGWANRYLIGDSKYQPNYRNLIAPFPNTYLCVTDIAYVRREQVYQLLSDQPNGGLFVSLTQSKNLWPNDNPTGPFQGPYLRLLFDTSVQRRMNKAFYDTKDKNGKPIRIGFPIAWFFDPTQEWIDAEASTY